MRDRYRLTPAHGWKCAECDLVVLEHQGERVPRCACGSELWSERVRVAVPQRLAELSRFAEGEPPIGDPPARLGHTSDCPKRLVAPLGMWRNVSEKLECSEACRKARGERP